MPHPLSRQRRKRLYIRVKNRARAMTAPLGGGFASRHAFDGGLAWADVYFLSRRGRRVYLACLQTSRDAYIEQLRALARERADAQALQPAGWGELTRLQWCQSQYAALANSGVVQVTTGWRLRRRGAHGGVLDAILDVPTLTPAEVQAFIEAFLAHEAPAHAGPTRSFAAHEIADWGWAVNLAQAPVV
jgi:hypothetical protein